MTFRGRNILRVKTPGSGVAFGNPEMEWREVARQNGYKFTEWVLLPVDEQEWQIAQYRMTARVQAVLAKDAIDKQRKPAQSQSRARHGR